MDTFSPCFDPKRLSSIEIASSPPRICAQFPDVTTVQFHSGTSAQRTLGTGHTPLASMLHGPQHSIALFACPISAARCTALGFGFLPVLKPVL